MSSLDKIAQIGVKKAFKKDEIIFMQGERGDCMYIVLKGAFGIYINSMTDFPVRVAELGAGQFFGEMSVLDGSPRSATVIADVNSIAISLAGEEFKKLLQCDSDFAFSLMRALSGRIRSLNERLEKGSQTAPLESDGTFDMSASNKDGKIFILPENHTKYELLRPQKYDFFVCDKNAACPCCGGEFTAELPIFSKLLHKDKQIEPDQRVIYENFSVLWFSVWVCPHCNYADFYSTFGNDSESLKAAMKELRKSGYRERVEKFEGSPSGSIDAVIKSYYLAMLCNQMGEKSAEKSAKSWLRLYWLYGDAGDIARKRTAAEKAYMLYEGIIRSVGTEEKMTMLSIVSELAIYLKNFEAANNYYQTLLDFSKKRSAVLYRQATERLAYLKKI